MELRGYSYSKLVSKLFELLRGFLSCSLSAACRSAVG